MFPLRRDSICYSYITETFYHSQTVDMLKFMSDLSTVGGRIRYYRLLNGLFQEDLCHGTGIDRTTIIRYENNQLIHSLDLCNKIAAAIGIEPSLLFDEYLSFISSDYGHKIKKARRISKLTQKELGQAIGVHRKTIVRWENERAYPTRENYEILKEFLRDPAV